MAPSIKAIQKAFPNLSPENVRLIRAAMEGKEYPRLGRTFTRAMEAMEEIDKILGSHGVEYIPRGHNQKSPPIAYCNMGDTYDTTVMLVNGNFRIGSWGDIVERGNYD